MEFLTPRISANFNGAFEGFFLGPLAAASSVGAELPSVFLYPCSHTFVAVRRYVREERGLVRGASKHRVGLFTIKDGAS